MNKDRRDILLERVRIYLEALPEESTVGNVQDLYALNHRLNYLTDALKALLEVVEDLSAEVDAVDSEH